MAIEAVALAATQEVAAGAANVEAARQLAEKVAMQTSEMVALTQDMSTIKDSAVFDKFQVGELTGKELDAKEVLKQNETNAINELSDKLENSSFNNNEMTESELGVDNKSDYYIQTINESLKGDLHPITGVSFKEKTVIDAEGNKVTGTFPEFDSLFDVQLPDDMLQASDAKQFGECNNQLKEAVEKNPELAKKFTEDQLEQIKNGDTPDGYTWHHNEEKGKMQLVDSETHARTGHTGGRSIWGGGSEFR